VRWTTPTEVVTAPVLESFLATLPPGVLRMKGFVDVRTASGDVVPHSVDVVGRTTSVVVAPEPGPRRLEAVGIADVLDASSLQTLAESYRLS
jgi:hypothetical protein